MFMIRNILLGVAVATVGIVGLEHRITNSAVQAGRVSDLSSTVSGTTENNSNSANGNGLDNRAQPQISGEHKPVCGSEAADSARCFARVIVDQTGSPKFNAGPVGFTSVQFRTAYGVATNTTRSLIAIVDAYDNPNIFSDVNTYSSRTGIVSMANGNLSTGACSIGHFVF